MPRPNRTRNMNIKLLFGVFALFFTLQIVFIMQPQYNRQHEAFILSIEKSDGEASIAERSTEATSNLPAKREMEEPFPNGPPDGTFNTFPIYHQTYKEGFHSNSHCIGENFGEDAWKYRSCQFQNLCFDTKDKEFVLFSSPEQNQLEKALGSPYLTSLWPASSMKTTVSVGGINPKWNKEALQLKWYPSIRDVEELKSNGYYMLQTDKVLIPFHSLAGFNPGHLVWDDFLPLFTLLSGFDLSHKQLMLIRYDLDLAMWAGCQRQWGKCKPILTKFLPLLGTQFDQTSSQNHTVLEIISEQKTKYVCAPNGAAGLGMLTDHGVKLHGWEKKDYEFSHNVGRGGALIQFRNWMMDNVGVEHRGRKIHEPPYRIIFSVGSSRTSRRNVNFHNHAAFLKKELGSKYQLDIREVKLAEMSLKDQIEVVAGASIFVSMCGGGAVTSTFLPKGASFFAFYNEDENASRKGRIKFPARLDWDLLNNMGYIRVHWLPRPRPEFSRQSGDPITDQGKVDMTAFVSLVDHELDVISHTDDY